MKRKLHRAWLLVLLLAFVLSGCAPNVALVGEATKNQLDLTSYAATISFALDTDVPTDELDATGRLVLQALRDGVVVTVHQKDPQHGHGVLSLKNPDPLLNSDLWPSQTPPSLEFYVEGPNVYLKSSLDRKFLQVPQPEAPLSPEMEKELNELVKSAIRQYIDQFGYNFKNVTTTSNVAVTLPDGRTVTTTHVKIVLDLAEAHELAVYFLENLSQFDGLDRFLTGIGQMTGEDMSQVAPEMKDALTQAASALKLLNVKELAARGVKADITAEYWIDANKRFVQDRLKVDLHVPGDVVPESGMPPLSLRMDIAGQYWNHNEPVQYPTLPDDRVVTVEQLAFNPDEFDSFGAGGPVRALAESAFVPFVDVPDSHWAYWPVTALRTLGVVSGYEDNRFLPNRPITRAEFAVMVVNALDLEPAKDALAFKDAKQIPAWAREALQAAVHTGLIRGYHDGTLRPNQPITRAELVTVLTRALKLPPADNHPLPYADRDRIPRWALPAVKAATAHGLVNGRSDNHFAPNDKATRAEAATILYRILRTLHNGQ